VRAIENTGLDEAIRRIEREGATVRTRVLKGWAIFLATAVGARPIPRHDENSLGSKGSDDRRFGIGSLGRDERLQFGS